MIIERLVLGELDTNCWLAANDACGPLLVIDPAGDADVLLGSIGDRPVALVVLTHAHFDHLGAAAALCASTGAPLAVHRLDAAAVTDAVANGGAMFGFDLVGPPPARLLEDGDVVEARGLRFEVLHTPGHTPGGICLFAPASPDASEPPHLFSGDTLFAGSVGRTDLAGGDAHALARSIAEKLASLPPDTVVHPGHGPETTIGREAQVNFFWPRR